MHFKPIALVVSMLVVGGLGYAALSERGRGLARMVTHWRQPEPQVIGGVPRVATECLRGADRRRFVALTFGQSNAANYVDGRHTATHNVTTYYEGRCYAGKDPVPGATGTGGSVWLRLGDALVASGRYDEAVFAGVAVSATSVDRWSVGGDLHERLIEVLKDMRARGLTPTHLLWHQGEADAKSATTAEAYREHFLRMVQGIRAAGISAPIYVAKASYCHGRSSDEIRAAQASLVDLGAGILAGPDTDALRGPAWRHDDCHFSAAGADRHASLWRDVLLAPAQRE